MHECRYCGEPVYDHRIETRRLDGSIVYGEICPDCFDKYWKIVQESGWLVDDRVALDV